MDFELAEAMLEIQKSLPERDETDDEGSIEDRARPSEGHTKEVEMLCQVVDAIHALQSTLVAVNLAKGKKPPRVEPTPRPKSAYEVLKEKSEMREVDIELANLGVNL